MGGDGTWSNVASAILRSGADCRLGLIAAGTGNDFAKSLAVPAKDLTASARLAVEGPDHRVDVGRIEDAWFVNTVGFGFDVAVLQDAARVRWLSGALLYAYTALHQLLRYSALEIAVDDGAASRPARRLLLVIANGRALGGAFQIAPDASLDDGLLDMVAIPDAPGIERLRLFIRATRGLHVRLPSVEVRQARRFSLRFESPPAYDLDGELRRARSSIIDIECVPAALRVIGSGAPARRESSLREPD